MILRGLARTVLRAYPAEFRTAVGPDLLTDLDRGWTLTRRTQGAVGALRYGLRQLVDLLGNLVREWRSPSGRGTLPPARRGARLLAALDDLRFAARSLRRDPLFAGTVLLVVALGIGAVVTVYGLLDAILLEPMPYPAAERLVSMSESYRETQEKSVSFPNYLDWRERNRAFDDIAARAWSSFNLTGEGNARMIWGQGLTENMLPLFGIEPIRGRGFSLQEVEEAQRVAIVSEGFWRGTLGGEADVLGRDLRLDGQLYTIVGVAPEQGEFPFADAQLWVPLTVVIGERAVSDRGDHPGIEAFGRVREGVTLLQARDDLDRVAGELAAEFPDTNAEAGARAGALKPRVIGDADQTLWLLLGAVVIVLVGVCANVASLMLARATRRGGELAVRSALGAGRGRLARQLLMEGLLLSVVAGGLGLLFAHLVLGALRGLDALDLPRLSTVGVDPSVATFAFAAAAVSGLLFAGAPAAKMVAVEPARSLRDQGSRGTTGSGSGARSALVVVQVALAVVLLAGAALMLRTLANLQGADLGIDPGNVITAYLGPPQSQYPTNEDRVQLYRTFADRVAALPGVRAVSGGDPLPMSGRNTQWSLSSDGFPQIEDDGLRVDIARLMPGYFDVMGIRLLAGRDFLESDGPDSPTAIVDETLAAFLWPDGPAIGNRVRFRGSAEDNPWFTVVGVAQHVKNYGLRNESRYELYCPYTIAAWGKSIVVEAEPGLAPETLVESMRAELARIDPELPLDRIGTVRANIDGTVAGEALMTRTLTGFAAATLLVAMIGLYGVIAYSVTLRRREFGIRMALGAGRAAVLRGRARSGCPPDGGRPRARRRRCGGRQPLARQPAVRRLRHRPDGARRGGGGHGAGGLRGDAAAGSAGGPDRPRPRP